MALVISRANSIRFAIQDSYLPNPENTLSYEEKYGSYATQEYIQRFDDASVVTIQCVSDTSTPPTVNYYNPQFAATTSASLVSSYVTDADPANWRYYFEFTMDFSSYINKKCYITVAQSGTTWKSEYITGEDLASDLANGKVLKVEYGNEDEPSDYMNFEIDYTTDISFYFYVEAILKESEHIGDDTVFTNIDEKDLIEAQLFLGSVLKTARIPKYMTELIWIASKHYIFKINDLEYVADGSPELENLNTNFQQLSLKVTQKNALGFNTDDRGLSNGTTDMIITRKIEDFTTTDSFVVPIGYTIHEFVCGHKSTSAAEYTFKAGYTVGGEELITDFIGVVPLTGGNVPIPVHEQKTFDTANTVYLTKLSGVGAIGKIWVQLIYNG